MTQPTTQPDPEAAVTPAARAAARPNFVVFLVDDMRAEDLRYMPHVQRLLVAQGRSYPNALSPHPLCCPARAELMTGQYGQNNGVRHNAGPHGGFPALRGKANTVARWLHDTGYVTGFVGKYLNAYTAADGVQAGWTRWKPLIANWYDYNSYRLYGEPLQQGYVTTAIASRTLKYIRDFHASGKPFLIMANHVAPHERQTATGEVMAPIPAPAYRTVYADQVNPARGKPSYNEADVSDKPTWIRRLPMAGDARLQALFLARIRALRSVDDAVNATVTALRDTGELANTYLIFTSDNGFSLGEHRWTHKDRLLAENLRIPLIIRGPGIGARSVDGRQATLLDLPVTIAARAGAPVQRTVDGLTLLGTRHRNTVLIQHGGSMDSTGGTQWSWRGVWTPRWTYARNTRNTVEETLYDRRVDRFELVNKAKDPKYAGVLAEMRRRYIALASCSGQTACNPVYGSEPVPSP